MRGVNVDELTVAVTIKGKQYYFYGDALTSPEQQAIIFLKKKDEEKEIF